MRRRSYTRCIGATSLSNKPANWKSCPYCCCPTCNCCSRYCSRRHSPPRSIPRSCAVNTGGSPSSPSPGGRPCPLVDRDDTRPNASSYGSVVQRSVLSPSLIPDDQEDYGHVGDPGESRLLGLGEGCPAGPIGFGVHAAAEVGGTITLGDVKSCRIRHPGAALPQSLRSSVA